MMTHRYLVWEGHHRGRRFKEMHIIGPDNTPICGAWKTQSAEYEAIYKGRPDGYALCQSCSRVLPEFEQAEKLRTWQALAKEAAP